MSPRFRPDEPLTRPTRKSNRSLRFAVITTHLLRQNLLERDADAI